MTVELDHHTVPLEAITIVKASQQSTRIDNLISTIRALDALGFSVLVRYFPDEDTLLFSAIPDEIEPDGGAVTEA